VGISAQDEQIRHHKTSFDEYTASVVEKLTISNRHGLVQYTGWDKDTLAVRISIWVEAPNEGIAAEVHDQINISQNPAGKTLSYSTFFSQDFFSNYNFGVDYHIFGPQNLELEILNRFGNIMVEEYAGIVTITGEYGHLKIAKFRKAISGAVIQITNGDLAIGDLINAEIIHKNGQFELGSVADLSLTTDFSSASIHSIENLKLSATTSKLNIEQAGSVDIKTKHSDIVISNIQQKGFIESAQGSVTIKSIDASVKELTISGDHCPIEVNINNKLPFNLHGLVTNGQFFYPENKKIRTYKENNTLSFSRESSSKNKPVPNLIIFNQNSDIQLIVNQ
jgi:hypothetical protein